jgi:hypothetical protein
LKAAEIYFLTDAHESRSKLIDSPKHFGTLVKAKIGILKSFYCKAHKK